MVSELSLALMFWMRSASGDWAVPAPLPVGHWTGAGHVATSDSTLPFDLSIAPDGAVTGRIGDAQIRTGSIIETSMTSRLVNHAQFQITATLAGPPRQHFTLYLNFRQGFLTGFTSRYLNDSRRESALVQVTAVVLHRTSQTTD